VHQLKNLELGKNTLSDLQKQLTKLSKQVRQLAADASSQYSAQINAVRSSLQRLQAGVSAAIANPSATSVSQLGTDAKALESSVTKLSKAVSSTC
jgi:chromosome segregation ATPase